MINLPFKSKLDHSDVSLDMLHSRWDDVDGFDDDMKMEVDVEISIREDGQKDKEDAYGGWYISLLKHDVCVCVLLPKHGHHVCSSNMIICGKI